MNSTTLNTISHLASRRDSLLALGGAGLAAALTAAIGAGAEAKAGKHGKKKCKDKCKPQVSQCTLVTTLICNDANDPDGCKEKFLPCCDHLATCNAGAMIQCIFI